MATETTDKQRKSKLLKGFIFAFCGALCWGFSGTCVSYLTATAGIDVIWLAFTRLAICGVVFIIASLFSNRAGLFETLRSPRELLRMLAIALIGVALMQLAYMNSIRLIGTGPGLLLMQTGLVIIMIVTCIQKRQLPNRRDLLALVLALAGVVAIATQGNFSIQIGALGLFWGIGTAVAMAGHNIIPVPLLHKYGSVVVNAVSMTMAAIILLPFAHPWNTTVQMTPMTWLVFAAVVILGTFLAYTLYMNGVKYLGPMRASLIAVLEPVSGMVFSAILLNQPITLWDTIGAVFIIAMMVLLATAKKD